MSEERTHPRDESEVPRHRFREQHYDPPGTYLVVVVALLVLTAATTGVAFLDIGAWNAILGMAFAVTKASLVFWFFMHIRHASALTRIVALGGLLWLGILIALTLADFASRGVLPPRV